MAFLATYWWTFLIGGFVLLIGGFFIQKRNMSKTLSSFANDNVKGAISGAKSTFATGLLLMALGGVCELLMTVGLIAAIIDYFKTS